MVRPEKKAAAAISSGDRFEDGGTRITRLNDAVKAVPSETNAPKSPFEKVYW